MVVTVGTGVGGGAVVHGRLLRGSAGAGMELGHMAAPYVPGLIDGEAPTCSCGRSGCLEAHVGGWALRKQWVVRLRELGPLSDAAEASVTLRGLLEQGQGGDTHAIALLRRAATCLGHGLRVAIQLLDPAVVVLGGGVVDGCPPWVGWVRKVLDATRVDAAGGNPKVRNAKFGNQAGVLGAIALAAERLGTVDLG